MKIIVIFCGEFYGVLVVNIHINEVLRGVYSLWRFVSKNANLGFSVFCNLNYCGCRLSRLYKQGKIIESYKPNLLV